MNLIKQSMVKDSKMISSRVHFEALDGLRGVAAIVVLLFHFLEIILPAEENPLMHGYLAVDFFFCLSGFVIAYAYDERMLYMSFSTFIKRRLIRLQPLVVIGSLLGLLTFLFNPYQDLFSIYQWKGTFWLFITSVLVIPYPVVKERFFNLFNLNAPMWSLFWEYVANIFYVLLLFRLPRKVLGVLCGIMSVVVIVWIGHQGDLLDGWGGANTAEGLCRVFSGGFIRVTLSFLLGMFVYRSRWILENDLDFWQLVVLLILAFLVPYRLSWNVFTESFIVVIYFPVIVALGAGIQLSQREGRVIRLLGDISYPLYMTHYPLMWIFGSYVATQHPTTEQLLWIIPVASLLLIGFSFLIFRFLDLPIRKYLINRQ